MQLRLFWLGWIVLGLVGCAQPQAIGPNDPAFSTVNFLKTHDAQSLSDSVLVADQPSANILRFKIEKVWNYVHQYAANGNDCPQGQFDSDCAHFQSHALAAAGIRITKPTAACTEGLSLRVKDLAIAFDNASKQYKNVTKFLDYHQAKRGDYCFLPRIEGAINDHMMLLEDTPDPQGARVWSHTNNRLGTHAPFDPTRCVFYRIEDR